MVEFVDFANALGVPFYGISVVVTFSAWLDTLAMRGPTVAHSGHYGLPVFSDALEFPPPTHRHSVKVAHRSPGKREVRKAPMVPSEFVLKIERIAADNSIRADFRLFCALCILMIPASLLFSDTIEVADIWRAQTPLCGRSVDQKLKGCELIPCAAIRRVIDSNGGRINPHYQISG